MYVKVTMVGLAESLAKRLRIAFSLQAAHGFKIAYAESFGSRAHMMVVDMAEATAGAVVQRAVQAGRTVLAFGEPQASLPGVTVVSRDTAIADLKSIIQTLLVGLRRQRPREIEAPARQVAPLILQLASGSIDARANLRLQAGDLDLVIRRGASRVLARSHSDILTGADRLMSTPWRVERLEVFDPAAFPGWISRSLDSFLVRAARTGGAALPRFPDVAVRLVDWPDLADSNDPLAAQLGGVLIGGLITIDSLVERTGADPAVISNLLWAFKASGLLAVSAGAAFNRPLVAKQAVSQDRRGLLARIARRFGMGVAVP